MKNKKVNKKLTKIKTNLFPESLKEEYIRYEENYKNKVKKWEEDKEEFIANYKEWVPGGFLSNGYYVSRPDIGKKQADIKYGKTYEEYEWGDKKKSFDKWASNYYKLNAVGEQSLIDKINELVDAVNKLTSKK